MELIIDVTENHLKTLQKMNECGLGYYHRAILNGTPLPKGHGRLIDAEDAIETLQIMFARDEDIQNACEQCISDCPTIIEEDKESKE